MDVNFYRACLSLAFAKVISAVRPSNICRFECTLPLPPFLPPCPQFLAYLAKTNIIPLQNEERRIALTPTKIQFVSGTTAPGVLVGGLPRSAAVSAPGSGRLRTAECLWREAGLMCDRDSRSREKKVYRLPKAIILMTS